MLRLDHKLLQTEASYGFGFIGFDVRPGKQAITLHFADGTLFSSTNTAFSNCLQGVFLAFPIRMEAIANIANVRDRIAKAKKANDAIVRVDINVFGPKSDGAVIGKMLSDGKIWLQKPDFSQKGVEYENPQFLKLEGFEEQQGDQQPLELASSQKRLEKDDEKFKETLEDVFNKLTRSDQLQRVEKDRRVKTELLAYEPFCVPVLC
jgi:SWI/SNF-related matrix-associated actin-dependent regulator of chromatin subfamily A3